MKGSCLCGTTRYSVDNDAQIKLFQYCHCTRCQKNTGSAHAANLFVAAEHFHWLSGEENLKHFKHPEAKYFATCFCSTCGSAMPWQAEGMPNMVIPAGSLDDAPNAQPQQSIFWHDHAPWYVDGSEIPRYDTLPPRKK